MNKLGKLLNIKNEDKLFNKITSSFKTKITKWDYFVDWKKIHGKVSPIEEELNLLNVLIGKDDIEQKTYELIKKYPDVINIIPNLIAIRSKSIEVLVDTKKFIYRNFSFRKRKLSDTDCRELANFFVKAGLGDLAKNKHIKNFVDYATGVEVGLDSNARKNRGGSLMEDLVETFVLETCEKEGLEYMPQATAKKIKAKWGIQIEVDKSSRQVDFAINKNGKLYFIECNFYGGGGSKLKSTATEYTQMNQYWNEQGIEFIWVTDGAGWKNTERPLREYFDKADYLLNLEMLKEGVLTKIISNEK